MVSKHDDPLKPRLSMRSRPIYPTSAASLSRHAPRQKKAYTPEMLYFYNLALFMSSVAVFSLIAQRMNGQK
ncbi:hypothetical protein D0865_12927 [Hortaea werneckii]|uniref:Uncharacterized protein n=1 Tax=Hortaea werneckii TaxID=91943 RepID=A0A3M7BH13_HORWE|nr:hypothetical protein D0865_12927 [Hortaea werneckii]